MERHSLPEIDDWLRGRRGRALAAGQRSELRVFDIAREHQEVILSVEGVIEAPNWASDGRTILFNAGGALWLLPAHGGSAPSRIEAGEVDDFNNDHVLSPDGETIYASSDDGHIYSLPVREARRNAFPMITTIRIIATCTASRRTAKRWRMSPSSSGSGKGGSTFSLFPPRGGPDQRITDLDLPHDGPEYSFDGQWIFFNSERASPGQSQCFRMRADGSGLEQLTHDERVNWFPHPSPDGRHVVYLSYPEGTQGHPPDRHVLLRLMRPDGSARRDLVALHGGQGTINVNSWAPDSNRLAFVAYPPGA